MFFELNINDGSYDRILDKPFMRLPNEGVPKLIELGEIGETVEPQDDIQPASQAIVELGYYQQTLRRSLRIH